MALYKKYAETPAIGYHSMSNWGGLELLDIDALKGENGAVVACFNWGTGRQHIRWHKIQVTASGRPYIRKNGQRFYFDQIIRA